LILNFEDEAPIIEKKLIRLSLLFVPGIYLVLILSAFLPIGLWLLMINTLSENTLRNSRSFTSLLGLGAVFAIYGCIKGIWITFFKVKNFQPAINIDLGNELKLKSFIQEICEQTGSDFPNSVIIHSEPTFFVQSGNISLLNGQYQGKILALGLPLLGGLTENELGAILTHEFAHFTGNDTVFSLRVLPVYISTNTSISYMKEKIESSSFPMAIALSIPLAILKSYVFIFRRIDMYISRSREKRADWIAAKICGTEVFSSALKKVIGISEFFQYTSIEDNIQILKDNKQYVNYYKFFRDKYCYKPEYYSKFISKAFNVMEDANSSHPTLKTRLNYLPIVQNSNNEKKSSISLFENLEIYEKELSEYLSSYILSNYKSEIEKRKEKEYVDKNPPILVRIIRCPKCCMRNYGNADVCEFCGKKL
jgi:Zn-dependent protease with chaperone function